jgi:hypothetical protein
MPIWPQQQLQAYPWGAAGILRNMTAGREHRTLARSPTFFRCLPEHRDSEADDKTEQVEQERGQSPRR